MDEESSCESDLTESWSVIDINVNKESIFLKSESLEDCSFVQNLNQKSYDLLKKNVGKDSEHIPTTICNDIKISPLNDGNRSVSEDSFDDDSIEVISDNDSDNDKSTVTITIIEKKNTYRFCEQLFYYSIIHLSPFLFFVLTKRAIKNFYLTEFIFIYFFFHPLLSLPHHRHDYHRQRSL